MTAVFLDTVGLLALWDEDDQWHQQAASSFQLVQQSRCAIVTSEFVLLECGNAAARRPYRSSVGELRVRMQQCGGLIGILPEDCELAWEAYSRHTAAGAGIVDQTSFLVMKRLGLTRAFTNDEHFRAAGFETLF